MDILESLDAIFAGAPFWLWLLIAAALGATTIWVYWRCRVDEAQTAEPIAPPPAAAIEPTAQPLLAEGPEDDEELNALRYRNWALETRLRRALDAARAGEPLDVAALSDGLEDILEAAPEALEGPALGDGAPLETVSALKYRNWRLEMRLAELEAAAAEAPPPAPAPEPVYAAAPVIDDARGDRMQGRVVRLLSAARQGQISVFEAVEQEMAEEGALTDETGAPIEIARLTPAPAGPSAADYQALAAELEAAKAEAMAARTDAQRAAALREAAETAADAAEAERLALIGRRDGLVAERDALSAERESLIEARDGLSAERAALADAASGLRYRRWLLSRRLGDAATLAREGRPLDVDALLADLARDGEAPLYGEHARLFAAPVPEGPTVPALAIDQPEPRLEAEKLRRRLAALETELARLRAAPPAAAEDAAAAAASTRYRLWLAQGELRRLRERPEPEPVPTIPEEELDALRRAAAAAEAAEARAASAGALVAGLRSEAWNAQHAVTRLEMRQSEFSARWRDLEAERDDAQAGRDAARAALTAAEGEVARLEAEIARLESRQRLLEQAAETAPTAEELRRRDAEMEALRARLALAQAETQRLQSALSAAQSALAAAPVIPVPVPAAPVAVAAPIPEPTPTPEPAPAPAPEPAPRPQPMVAPRRESVVGEPPRERHPALKAALTAMIATPRRGVEAAAWERVQSGQVAAVGSNRPSLLLEEPLRGAPDRLSLIFGVSEKLEARMARFGLFYFEQLARFSAEDLAWLNDKLGLSGEVVNERWLPQAERLADLKRAGRLALDADGKHGRYIEPTPSDRPIEPAGWESGARRAAPEPLGSMAHETIDSLPRHPRSIIIDAPLSGAEMAGLELLAAPERLAPAAQRPASFSKTPFAPGDDLDDLQAIRGVGPNIERALRALGVGRYRQLALMTPAEAAWLDRRLDLGGRVLRDRWLPQARALAERAEAERRLAAEREIASAIPLQESPPRPLPEAERAAPGALAGRPRHWRAAPTDEGDDLKAIRYIGPKQESQLKSFGFHSFEQLAAFSEEDLAWLDRTLGVGGRAAAEGWARQAKRLAALKREGALRLGPEGTWTLPDPTSDRSAALTAATRSALTAREREALQLIESGAAAAAENRPHGLLAGPSAASPDPLREMDGITAEIEQGLHGIGIYYFRQIARLDGPGLAWIDAALGLGGELVRRRVAAQAEALERMRDAV